MDAKNVSYEFASTLEETVPGMLSDDYKKRFIAEYNQCYIRYKKLGALVHNMLYNRDKLNFEPKCSIELLMSQLNILRTYLCILKERACIEGIGMPDIHNITGASCYVLEY